MRISSLQRLSSPPSAAGWQPIARFTVHVTEDVLLYDVLLSRGMRDSSLRVFPALRSHNAPTASLSPAARAEIIRLAVDALKEETNDQRAA